MERLLNLANQQLQQVKNYNEAEQREKQQIRNVRAKLMKWKREKTRLYALQSHRKYKHLFFVGVS